MNPEQLKTASISSIAAFIVKDCHRQGKLVPPAAKPYIAAMSTMTNASDNYGLDSGHSIIAYGLGNLTGWKGENARNTKKELLRRIK